MKRMMKVLGAALGAAVLLATSGCDTIRDYSVNSYQGILPANAQPQPHQMTDEVPVTGGATSSAK